MENWDRFFFHYNNKLEGVSQSTTMRINRREVSADFKNSRHRETTTIPTETKIKITILNTFYCVTECLPLTSSEKDDFPDCRSCSVVSLAVVRLHRFTQFNKTFQRQMAFVSLAEFALDRSP